MTNQSSPRSHRIGGPISGDDPAGNSRVSPLLPLIEAEQVIDALNVAVTHEGSARERATALLRSYQELLGGNIDVQLILHDDLQRPTGPRVRDRVWVGPTLERIEPRPDAEIQWVIDKTPPAVRAIIPDAMTHLRRPRVFIVGQDLPEDQKSWWEASETREHLRKHGWADLMIGYWASGPDRMVGITAYQPTGAPAFGPEERRLASLMVRAAAPLIHGEMFDSETVVGPPEANVTSPLEGRDLSTRQRDVLRLLLRGMSEKEVGNALGVSTHTVHTHVKRLYTEFDVTSRGELLARFIDRRMLQAADAT